MGVLSISTGGSFPSRTKQFGAITNGHAHAVAEAIKWLSDEVLPAAIEQDHRLHDEGSKPRNGFDRPARAPVSPEERRGLCPRCDGKGVLPGPDGRAVRCTHYDSPPVFGEGS